MDELKCVHILVEGVVQGVGFRFFVQHQAMALGLTGWVRNRFDDRVEILAQGPETDLQQLIALVRVGPPSATVTDLVIEWSRPSASFQQFSIAASI